MAIRARAVAGGVTGTNGQGQAVPSEEHGPGTVTQSGATLFAELVWAHHRWRRGLEEEAPDPALERAYHEKLARFQEEEGLLEHVYWSTREASAVAMTVRDVEARRRPHLRLRERDTVIRLHRLTDWATRDSPAVADLMHECDVLAIRVGEILRGTSERIAMRSILGIQAHLLGLYERHQTKPSKTTVAHLVESQRQKLRDVEEYYMRAAGKAGRIVYVGGMLIGLCIAAAVAAVAAVLLRLAGLAPAELNMFMLCFGAGAIGAFVSAVSRMGRSERSGFSLDFEIGRPLVRRLGVYRPFVGAVFGVVLYLLLKSGILDLRIDAGSEPYYFGFAAFLAGFSERFATVLLGAAETRLGAAHGGETAGGPAGRAAPADGSGSPAGA